MPGVEHGDGIAAGNRLGARGMAKELGTRGLRGVEIDERGGIGVEVHQHRIGQGRR